MNDPATGIPYFLPKNFIEIKVTKTPTIKDNIQTIEYLVEARPILIPDTTNRFLLKHKQQPMASDRLCVTRSTTGLLQSVQFATDDKTDEVVIKISELAAKVAKTAIVPVPVLGKKFEEEKKETAIALGEPNDRQLILQIQRILPEITDIKFPDFSSSNSGANRKCPEDNICFSTLTQARLLLEGEKDGVKFNAATTVPVVDFDHVGKLRVDRPFLVDQVTKLGFTDGVLTSMAFKRPSEGLAVVSLPLDILDAVLAVPANFFSTALGGIFSDQKVLLEHQQQLATLQQQILQKQNKSRSASAGTAEAGTAEAGTAEAGTAEADTNFKLECMPLTKKN
ncbi:hypothetical protein [Nitrosospira multiformis]|uniref:hypothetical protein n=1 Tax=Nitrosospira multiformis TaxID=1231 RepID=UPI001C40B62F|nr:hypothetical protein [Nitrosospira multiformis]